MILVGNGSELFISQVREIIKLVPSMFFSWNVTDHDVVVIGKITRILIHKRSIDLLFFVQKIATSLIPRVNTIELLLRRFRLDLIATVDEYFNDEIPSFYFLVFPTSSPTNV